MKIIETTYANEGNWGYDGCPEMKGVDTKEEVVLIAPKLLPSNKIVVIHYCSKDHQYHWRASYISQQEHHVCDLCGCTASDRAKAILNLLRMSL